MRRILAVSVSLATADHCHQICLLAPEVCGAGGSYCKNSFACHDLFWLNQESICSSAVKGCVDKPILTCEQAETHFSVLASTRSGLPGTCSVPSGTPGPSIPRPGIRGIRNIGNTCYMSAALQLISHVTLLRDMLLAEEPSAFYLEMRTDPSESMIGELNRMFREMWLSPMTSPLDPTNISAIAYSTMGFTPGNLEDSQEAVRGILGLLSYSPIGSIIHSIFTTQVEVHLTCSNCNSTRILRDDLEDFFLSLPGNPTSIESLIQSFMAPERITNCVCERCNVRGICEAKRVITEFPPALLIPLKRYDNQGWKLMTLVSAPMELNFSTLVPPDQLRADTPTYRLKSVVHHTGSSANSGHYFSDFVLNNEWFRADDHIVTPFNQSMINSIESPASSPVMYLYERV